MWKWAPIVYPGQRLLDPSSSPPLSTSTRAATLTVSIPAWRGCCCWSSSRESIGVVGTLTLWIMDGWLASRSDDSARALSTVSTRSDLHFPLDRSFLFELAPHLNHVSRRSRGTHPVPAHSASAEHERGRQAQDHVRPHGNQGCWSSLLQPGLQEGRC
jgi:hypothetical protein